MLHLLLKFGTSLAEHMSDFQLMWRQEKEYDSPDASTAIRACGTAAKQSRGGIGEINVVVQLVIARRGAARVRADVSKPTHTPDRSVSARWSDGLRGTHRRPEAG